MGPYISQLLPNLSAALLKLNGPHLRVSCSEIFSAALSGKSNQCNALYLQINLLCTRHTLFVPSHQYKYTTLILSTGFVLCSSSLRQLASNRLDGRHMGSGCLFFHILNDRRICRIYGHRQKNVFILLLCISIWERKMTGNATSSAIQIFVEKIVL